MTFDSSDQRKLADHHDRHRAERLLQRYPDISLEDRAYILRFLKKAPPLEVAHLDLNDELKDSLRQFRADHARQFSTGPRDMAILGGIILLIVLAVVLLWDAGAAG